MVKSLNSLIGLTNRDHLVVFKFQNSKIELKGNFGNNWKNSNARKCL